MKSNLIKYENQVTKEWLDVKIGNCIEKLKLMLPKYTNHFPSACTTDMHYRIKGNDDWTNGFWTAMLWQAYEVTHDKLFKDEAEEQLESFRKRLDQNVVLNHHDIGFLYSLSAYAGYLITGNLKYKKLVIDAADVLIGRFQKHGGFIQAWGDLDDDSEYRLIIDSLLNLPLLFEASKLSGENIYKDIAKTHYENVIKNIIRSDYSTYHTFYFDRESGKPDHGATHQGFSNESCWARGQGWILLGMPLYDHFMGDKDEKNLYHELLKYYLSHLPKDGIPYWDLVFTDQDRQPRDSSAAAIVACGLIQAQQQDFIDDGIKLAKGMIFQLGENYETEGQEEGLLKHGVYAYASNKGVDEANLWGDYFYLEALMRLRYSDWKTYW